MKCTFYRPENGSIGEFSKILEGLQQDFNTVRSGEVSKQEVCDYLKELLSQERYRLLPLHRGSSRRKAAGRRLEGQPGRRAEPGQV